MGQVRGKERLALLLLLRLVLLHLALGGVLAILQTEELLGVQLLLHRLELAQLHGVELVQLLLAREDAGNHHLATLELQELRECAY